jgi:hypothetical protein
LNRFIHKAATVIAIGSEDLKRRNHPAFKSHHLALIGVARIPADGEIPALPAIRRFARTVIGIELR